MAKKSSEPKSEPAPEPTPPAAEPPAAPDEQSAAPAEHPRRVNPPGKRYGDKQLRQNRIRGGYDTKG